MQNTHDPLRWLSLAFTSILHFTTRQFQTKNAGASKTHMTNQVDFSIWEELYKRPLSEIEKIEIKNNLLDFSKTIIAERLKHQERALLQELEQIKRIKTSFE
jgi:hypothetical protein